MLVKIKFQKLNLRNQSVMQQTENNKTRNSQNTTHLIMQAIRLELTTHRDYQVITTLNKTQPKGFSKSKIPKLN